MHQEVARQGQDAPAESVIPKHTRSHVGNDSSFLPNIPIVAVPS